eukprot:5782432-Pleurochrysis_carterae.AAC.1
MSKPLEATFDFTSHEGCRRRRDCRSETKASRAAGVCLGASFPSPLENVESVGREKSERLKMENVGSAKKKKR